MSKRRWMLTPVRRYWAEAGDGLLLCLAEWPYNKNSSKKIQGCAKAIEDRKICRGDDVDITYANGLEEKDLICGMNEEEGRFVLNEILQTGNFGQGDTRYKYTRWFRLRHHIAH